MVWKDRLGICEWEKRDAKWVWRERGFVNVMENLWLELRIQRNQERVKGVKGLSVVVEAPGLVLAARNRMVGPDGAKMRDDDERSHASLIRKEKASAKIVMAKAVW